MPINKELTPEQVIESEYSGLEYKYKVYDDVMFVCVKNEYGSALRVTPTQYWGKTTQKVCPDSCER